MANCVPGQQTGQDETKNKTGQSNRGQLLLNGRFAVCSPQFFDIEGELPDKRQTAVDPQ
jgi:hypothetical protein